MKKKKIKRCISTFCKYKDNELMKILRFLSSQTKNIYNHYIFCYNIFVKYKQLIFDELINLNNFNDINKKFTSLLEKYFNFHNLNKKYYFKNNKIIYDYICYKGYLVTHSNIYDLIKEIKNKLCNWKSIKFTNNKVFFDDIIENILISFYRKNFRYIKDCLINKKPYNNITNENFINHVKTGQMLERKFISFKNFKEKFKKLKTHQNLIQSFAYNLLKKNNGIILSSNLTQAVMRKAYNAISSFYSLKDKGIKANFPKYLSKEHKYVLPFLGQQCAYVIDKIKHKTKIKLPLGIYFTKYFINNINEILGKNYKIKEKQYYKEENPKILHPIKYLEFTLCDRLTNILGIDYGKKNNDFSSLRSIEIIPVYNGYKFKLNYIYEKNIEIDDINKKGDISIDLGMINLMTIYDPKGKQRIIKGGKIIWINNKYNYHMKNLQSKISKNKEDERLKRIYYNSIINRENRINYEFNRIVYKLFEMYKNKKRIIIGYNENWKTKVSMGKKNNERFYKIPYYKLINKIKDKGEEYGIEVKITEESYTSKCDALNLEKIERHEIYSGERIKRGLYSSGKDKEIKKNGKIRRVHLINADLNGAINIMRKVNKDIKKIKGKKLYNPQIIKIN